jgi:hypothetical protein
MTYDNKTSSKCDNEHSDLHWQSDKLEVAWILTGE